MKESTKVNITLGLMFIGAFGFGAAVHDAYTMLTGKKYKNEYPATAMRATAQPLDVKCFCDCRNPKPINIQVDGLKLPQ